MILSVIIPTYNRAHYLFKALDSLKQQHYDLSAFEVLVIDDGSSDKTAEVVKSFNGDLDIKYFKRDHAGVSAARNFGINNSRGDILVFFDDDAVADKEWLKNISQVMATELVVVGRGQPLTKNIWQYFAPHYDRGNELLVIDTIWECNLIVKKEVFDKIGVFNEQIGWGHEGNEFARRLLGHYQIKYYPDILVYHDYAAGLFDYFNKQFIFGEKLVYLKRQEIKSFYDLLNNYSRVKKIGEGIGSGNPALAQLSWFRRVFIKIIAKIGSWIHFIGSVYGYFEYKK